MAEKPVRSLSHRNEDKSKRKFEELIEPFVVSAWTQKDYGIDGIVDIGKFDRDANSIELLSKCFLVQLKSGKSFSVSSGKIAYSVPTKKLSYWYNYNLPVAFCLYDTEKDIFYIRWIDEDLISALDTTLPNWPNQQTVTIKIPLNNILNENCLEAISKYVYSWKMPARRKLEPGKYFKLKETGFNFINEYREITTPFGFDSINTSIKRFESDIDQSIYRIAITGLSRVGKSSLINLLLNKEISPTGLFQTTGVPIQIVPGSEDKVTVFFNNGEKTSSSFSIDFIKEYADQAINEDNNKQVSLVMISIRNQNLERGVSIYDIPGLDDPNDDILTYTWQTVNKSNAVIYVIDASLFENGGFIFKNEYKKHIAAFSQGKEKVFLVFNKVDVLSEGKLTQFKERIVFDLKKHGLYESVEKRIFYLSTGRKVAGANTILELNDEVWNYILSESKFGIAKLSLVNQELYKSTKSLTQILQARLIDDEKRKKLDSSIKEVRDRLVVLQLSFTEYYINKNTILCQSIREKKNLLVSNLTKWLKAVPSKQELPNRQIVKTYISSNINATIEQLNDEYVLHFNEVKKFVDTWIEDNLKQIREILSKNPDQKKVDFTEIDSFELPQIEISSAWGMGAIGFLLGATITVPAAIIAALFGFFGNLVVTAESRRQSRITKIIENANERCDSLFGRMAISYSEYFNEHCIMLGEYADEKIELYFKDIENQISQLDAPIDKAQEKLYKSAFLKIDELQNRLSDYDAELRSYFFC